MLLNELWSPAQHNNTQKPGFNDIMLRLSHDIRQRQFDGGSLMPTSLKRDRLVSFANEHRTEFESLLRRFVETPTVSVDPNHLDDIRKGVELTVETLESFGV